MKNTLVLLFAAILYSWYSPFFSKINPVSYSVSLPDKFRGALSVNDRLEKVEKLHEGEIHWPEAFAVHKGEIFTGLGDGRIVKISEKQVIDVCRIGKNCIGQHNEHICGRPLGMEFDKDGVLYVADAYHGLFTVNVQTGEKKQILPSVTVVDGSPLFFLNDLAISEKEDVIYLTQSSTRWNISHVVVSILEHDTSGRLLKYDRKTGQVSVLVRGISFANGVEISHDGASLLIAEGNEHKIIRYYLNHQKEMDELPLILPGEPDNISRNPRGNYWVGISSARTTENPTLYDRVCDRPCLRKWFLHLQHLLSGPIAYILDLVPSPRVRDFAFELRSGRIIADMTQKHGVIIEIDDQGTVLQSLHSPSGKMAHVSEVLEHQGHLYLGSWRNGFLGRVKL